MEKSASGNARATSTRNPWGVSHGRKTQSLPQPRRKTQGGDARATTSPKPSSNGTTLASRHSPARSTHLVHATTPEHRAEAAAPSAPAENSNVSQTEWSDADIRLLSQIMAYKSQSGNAAYAERLYTTLLKRKSIEECNAREAVLRSIE